MTSGALTTAGSIPSSPTGLLQHRGPDIREAPVADGDRASSTVTTPSTSFAMLTSGSERDMMRPRIGRMAQEEIGELARAFFGSGLVQHPEARGPLDASEPLQLSGDPYRRRVD